MTCRFINADSILDAGGILGYNMFAYCSNNPIMRKDPSGKTFLYDPDEPDWASSYNQAQLDMIYRIGIDEFASYDSWVQDAMLYSALMGESFIGDRGGEIHNYLMENAQMGRSHNQFANEYYALVIQEELWNEPIIKCSETI